MLISKPLLVLSTAMLSCFLSSASHTYGQKTGEPAPLRPDATDKSSERLINNYLTASGGIQAHRKIQNIVARGTIKESTLQRNFELIETADGRRHLTYEWVHLGRAHNEVFVYDGVETWTQIRAPKEQPAEDYKGLLGQHFSTQRWLFHPFTLPTRAKFVFEYKGTARVNGRSTFVAKGYGRNDIPSWFYFDKEQSLVFRWGGPSLIAGVKEQIDYRATEFEKVSGVIMPSRIDLLAQNAPYGVIEFSEIMVNQNLSDVSFYRPKSNVPVLRQVAP